MSRHPLKLCRVCTRERLLQVGATANALKAQLRSPAGHSNDFQPGLLKGEGVEVHQLAAGVHGMRPAIQPALQTAFSTDHVPSLDVDPGAALGEKRTLRPRLEHQPALLNLYSQVAGD